MITSGTRREGQGVIMAGESDIAAYTGEAMENFSSGEK